MSDRREAIRKAIERADGILNLHPEWVARDFIAPGRRLGLKAEEYDVGERGFICERWLASVTRADNAVGPEHEGLSRLRLDAIEDEVTLKEAVDLLPELIMGREYAATHRGLGRLVKVYDFGSRIPFHFHQMQRDAAQLGRNSKDEAYYFLEDVDMGPHPETFFGLHPSVVERREFDRLLPYLEQWNSDEILKLSRAYLNIAGEGFYLPSGILHAPGTAVTLELQEDSDVGSFVQARNDGRVISKELLYKDVSPEQRERLRERAVLEQLDWSANGDPYFYENHHLSPVPVDGMSANGARAWWIFYNTSKFSGKKLEIEPGSSLTTSEKGVFSLFVWRGDGEVDGRVVHGGSPGSDELLVCHDRAVRSLTIRNTGATPLKLFKFFGPDINGDAPHISRYPSRAGTNPTRKEGS